MYEYLSHCKSRTPSINTVSPLHVTLFAAAVFDVCVAAEAVLVSEKYLGQR